MRRPHRVFAVPLVLIFAMTAGAALALEALPPDAPVASPAPQAPAPGLPPAAPVPPPSSVQTVPLKPPVEVDIVREARPLGRSPADVEIDEVTFDPAFVVKMPVSGASDDLPTVMPAAIAKLNALMAAAKLRAAGPLMAYYITLGDGKFTAELMAPLTEAAKQVPDGLQAGLSPKGVAVRVVHEGAYRDIDLSYNQILAFIEDRDLDIQDVVIERFMRDPAATPEGEMVVEILVPEK